MDFVALLGRAALSAIFIWSGFGKLMAPLATINGFARWFGAPLNGAAYVVAVVVEIVGGVALLAGVRPRGAALVLAIWCIATALVAHRNWGDHAQLINFMKNIAMFGGLLQVFVFGAGRYAFHQR
ncbi:MAG: DoxX family protein [Acetobacteraceae bacterium]|nr:DoxX family protein [Acetobacteraceae bacterium]MBV8590864.1 DoxX family protein [Acetobacteraceae bacterium]